MTTAAIETPNPIFALPLKAHEKEKVSVFVVDLLDEMSSTCGVNGSEAGDAVSISSLDDEPIVDSLALGDKTIPYAIDTSEFDDHYELAHVSEILNHPCEYPSIPEGLASQTKDTISHVMLKEIHFSHPIMRTIAMPLDKGLMAMCGYYKAKYDVDIFVCGKMESMMACVRGDYLDPSITTWGMIASDHSLIYGSHVTAVLCHKKACGTIQMFNLDSVKKAIRPFAYAYNYLKSSMPNFERITLNMKRQSDGYSCRTDALIVLKDALRELKVNKPDDLKAYVGGIQTPHDPKKFIAKLPFSWARTSQISRVYKEGLKTLLVGKKETSVEDFKVRFKIPMDRMDIFRVYGHDQSGNIFVKEMGMKTSINADLYLNYKGKKNYTVMANFLKQLTEPQRAHLEFLKRCY